MISAVLFATLVFSTFAFSKNSSLDRVEYKYLDRKNVRLTCYYAEDFGSVKLLKDRYGNDFALSVSDDRKSAHATLQDNLLEYIFKCTSGKGIFGKELAVGPETVRIWDLQEVYRLEQDAAHSLLEYGDSHSLLVVNHFPVNRMSEFHSEVLKDSHLRFSYYKRGPNSSGYYSIKAPFLMETVEQRAIMSSSSIAKGIVQGNPEKVVGMNPFGNYSVFLDYNLRELGKEKKQLIFKAFEFNFAIVKPAVQSLHFGTDVAVEGSEFKVIWRSDKCANIDFKPIGKELEAVVHLYRLRNGKGKIEIASKRVPNYCRHEKFVTFEAPRLDSDVESIELTASFTLTEKTFTQTGKVETDDKHLVIVPSEDVPEDVRSWTFKNELIAGDTLDVTLFDMKNFEISEEIPPQLSLSGFGAGLDEAIPVHTEILSHEVCEFQGHSMKYRLSVDWRRVPLTSIFKEFMISGSVSGNYLGRGRKIFQRSVDIRPIYVTLNSMPRINFSRGQKLLPDDATIFVGEEVFVSFSNFPNLSKDVKVNLFADYYCLGRDLKLNGFNKIQPINFAFSPARLYLEIVEAKDKQQYVKIPLQFNSLKVVDFEESNKLSIAFLHNFLPTTSFTTDQEISIKVSVANELPVNIEQVASMLITVSYGKSKVESRKWIISEASREYSWVLNPRKDLGLYWTSGNGPATFDVKVEYYDFEGTGRVIKAPFAVGSFSVGKPMISAISLQPAQYQIGKGDLTVSWKTGTPCPANTFSLGSFSPFPAVIEIIDVLHQNVIQTFTVEDYCLSSSVSLPGSFLDDGQVERDILARIGSFESQVIEVRHQSSSPVPLVLAEVDGDSLFFPGKPTLSLAFDVSSDRSLCSADRGIVLEAFAGELAAFEAKVVGVQPFENLCILVLSLEWQHENLKSSIQAEQVKSIILYGQMRTQTKKVRQFQPLVLDFEVGSVSLKFSHPVIADAKAFFVGEEVDVQVLGNRFDLRREFCNVIDENLLQIFDESSSQPLMTFNVCEEAPIHQLPAKSLYTPNNVLLLSAHFRVRGSEFNSTLSPIATKIYYPDASIILFKARAELNEEIQCSGSWKNLEYGDELLKRNVSLVARRNNSEHVVYQGSVPMNLINSSTTALPPFFSLEEENLMQGPFTDYYVELVQLEGSESGKIEFIRSRRETFKIARPSVTSLSFGSTSITEGQSFRLYWVSPICSLLPKNSTLLSSRTLQANLTVTSSSDRETVLFSATLDSFCNLHHEFQTSNIHASQELIATMTFPEDPETILETSDSLSVLKIYPPAPQESPAKPPSTINLAIVGGIVGALGLLILITGAVVSRRYQLHRLHKGKLVTRHVFHNNPLFKSNYANEFTDVVIE